jgi:hypothetical protein
MRRLSVEAISGHWVGKEHCTTLTKLPHSLKYM